jgi:hypothetical protein
MDLSKLPKLSQTPPPPAEPAAPPAVGSGATTPPTAPALELFCRCGAPITPGTNFCSHCGASYQDATGGRARRETAGLDGGGMWVEALLSVAFGLFLLLVAPHGIQYLSSTMMGKPFTPYDAPQGEGSEKVDFLRYQDTTTGVITDYKYRDMFEAYWSDMVVTAFALVLIFDGIVMAIVRRPWAMLLAGVLIAIATLLNVWYVVASYTRTNPRTGGVYGLPIMSMMAVIAGIAMAGYQFRAFADSRRR